MDIYPDFGAFGDNTTIQTVIGALLTFVLVAAVLTMLISPALPGRSLPPTATTPLLPKRTPGSSPPSNKPPSKQLRTPTPRRTTSQNLHHRSPTTLPSSLSATSGGPSPLLFEHVVELLKVVLGPDDDPLLQHGHHTVVPHGFVRVWVRTKEDGQDS